MNNLIKLGLAAMVGLIAAFLNFQSLQTQITPSYYVRVTQKISAGQMIPGNALEQIGLTGVAEDLNKSLVPWANRDSIKEARAARTLGPGHIVFWQDISPTVSSLLGPGEAAVHVSLSGVNFSPTLLAINRQVSFVVRKESTIAAKPNLADPSSYDKATKVTNYEILGPFRIIGIDGGFLPKSSSADQVSASSSQVGTITLAVKTDGGTLDRKVQDFIAASKGVSEFGTLDAVMVIPEPTVAAIK